METVIDPADVVDHTVAQFQRFANEVLNERRKHCGLQGNSLFLHDFALSAEENVRKRVQQTRQTQRCFPALRFTRCRWLHLRWERRVRTTGSVSRAAALGIGQEELRFHRPFARLRRYASE